MGYWKITWFDSGKLREAITPYEVDLYSIASALSGMGCYSTSYVIKIERVPQA